MSGRWRRAGEDPHDRTLALALGLAGAGVVAFASVASAWAGPVAGALPACPFRAWTGCACPTCGMTRAALSLARGDVARAFAYQPLGVTVTGAIVTAAVFAPAWWRLGLPVPGPEFELPRAPRIAFGLAVLLNWAYLVLKGI